MSANSINNASTNQPLTISAPAQVRALASPARQEIVDVLAANGPASMAELARLLGRPADGLYFHVRRLLKLGLLIEGGTRPTGRRAAATYDVAGRPLQICPERVRAADRSRVLAAALRLGLRDFSRAAADRAARAPAERRAPAGGRAKGWVGQRERARIQALIEEIHTLLHRGRPGRGRQLQTFVYVWTPAAVSPRARQAVSGD